jgi:hypothetical protein
MVAMFCYALLYKFVTMPGSISSRREGTGVSVITGFAKSLGRSCGILRGIKVKEFALDHGLRRCLVKYAAPRVCAAGTETSDLHCNHFFYGLSSPHHGIR